MRRHTLSGGAVASHKGRENGGGANGKEWLANEREKFLQLLRVRHPHQAAAVENELQWRSNEGRDANGMPRRLRQRRGGVMYLQHNGETRRVAIPSKLTMASLRSLFADTFPRCLHLSQLEPPMGTIYIQDPASTLFYQLVDARDVQDKSLLTVHLFNPRSSLASSVAPTTERTKNGITSTKWHEKAASFAFDANSELSVEKLEKMQEHLSQLTGLVHQAVQSRGKSLGTTAVDVPPPPQERWRRRDEFDDSLSSSSTSVAMGNEFLNHPPMAAPAPPKPKRLYLEKERRGADAAKEKGLRSPFPVQPSGIDETPVVTVVSPLSKEFHRWAYRPLSIDEKDFVAKSADGLVRNIRRLKGELDSMRRQHVCQCETFAELLKECGEKISAAIQSGQPKQIIVNGESRGALIKEEEGVEKETEKIFQHIEKLDTTIEEIGIDVLKRQCRVNVDEIMCLQAQLKLIGNDLTEEKTKFDTIRDKVQPIMTSELEVIVKEEKFLKKHAAALEKNFAKFEKMQKVLTALAKYKNQPVTVVVPTAYNPSRADLFENILALAPNHMTRAKAVQAAEQSYSLRKHLLASRQVEQVNALLQRGRKRLKPVRRVLQQLESRRDDFIKRMYLEDQQPILSPPSPRDMTATGRYYKGREPLHASHRQYAVGNDDDDGEMNFSRDHSRLISKQSREYDSRQSYYRNLHPTAAAIHRQKGHSLSPPVQAPASHYYYHSNDRHENQQSPYRHQPIDPRHAKSASWTRSASTRERGGGVGFGDVSEYYSRSGPSISYERRRSPLSPPSGRGSAGGQQALARGLVGRDAAVRAASHFHRKVRPLSGVAQRKKQTAADLDMVTTDL